MKKCLMFFAILGLFGCHRKEIVIDDPSLKNDKTACQDLISDFDVYLSGTTDLFNKERKTNYVSTQIESWKCNNKDSVRVTILLTMEYEQQEKIPEKGECTLTVRSSVLLPLDVIRNVETNEPVVVNYGNAKLNDMKILNMECK